jgi:hypothetical protein
MAVLSGRRIDHQPAYQESSIFTLTLTFTFTFVTLLLLLASSAASSVHKMRHRPGEAAMSGMQPDISSDEIRILGEFERKVPWLASYMIHHANHRICAPHRSRGSFHGGWRTPAGNAILFRLAIGERTAARNPNFSTANASSGDPERIARRANEQEDCSLSARTYRVIDNDAEPQAA